MQKIIIVKPIEKYKEGDIVMVNESDAHKLIEYKFAKLVQSPKNKMMKPERSKKGYKIK